MPLLNKTKNIVIEKKVRIANSFFSQLKGLMFERKKNFDYALIFPLFTQSRASASIHCMFVFFPIDVIYLDNKKKVVDKKNSVKPFTLFEMPSRPAKYFIELNAGKAKGTEIGDTLEW